MPLCHKKQHGACGAVRLCPAPSPCTPEAFRRLPARPLAARRGCSPPESSDTAAAYKNGEGRLGSAYHHSLRWGATRARGGAICATHQVQVLQRVVHLQCLGGGRLLSASRRGVVRHPHTRRVGDWGGGGRHGRVVGARGVGGLMPSGKSRPRGLAQFEMRHSSSRPPAWRTAGVPARCARGCGEARAGRVRELRFSSARRACTPTPPFRLIHASGVVTWTACSLT